MFVRWNLTAVLLKAGIIKIQIPNDFEIAPMKPKTRRVQATTTGSTTTTTKRKKKRRSNNSHDDFRFDNSLANNTDDDDDDDTGGATHERAIRADPIPPPSPPPKPKPIPPPPFPPKPPPPCPPGTKKKTKSAAAQNELPERFTQELETPKNLRAKFDYATSGAAFQEERDRLWDQLKLVPLEKRRKAERLLIYMVIERRDNIIFSTRGRVIVGGHEIPASNVAVALTSLLTPTAKAPAIAEIALLQNLRDAPKGLWDMVPKEKKRWLFQTETPRNIITPDKVLGPPSPPRPQSSRSITKNPRDGLISTTSLPTRSGTVDPSSVERTTLSARKSGKSTKPDTWYQQL